MDTLHDRLAELADDAPTGGARPAELWARGRRAHRVRAAAVVTTVLVVGAVGTGIGVRLADDDGNGSDLAPAVNVDISLPIEYPVGQELPDLGNAPGPLAAIWVAPRAGGGAPEVTGLVAETGAFGTLAIDVLLDVKYWPAAMPGVALSPDGRRIAYNTGKVEDGEVVVHDLVSGEQEFPAIEDQGLGVYDWIDATHLYGGAGTTDSNGWVWEPGTAAKLVDFVDYPSPGAPYLGAGWPYGGTELTIGFQGPRPCADPPRLEEVTIEDPYRTTFEVPLLCDVLGVVDPAILLGHWNSEHSSGGADDPGHAEGTVVALDIHGVDRPYLDSARRQVVVGAGAPHRVAFATDLIGQALEVDGGAS